MGQNLYAHLFFPEKLHPFTTYKYPPPPPINSYSYDWFKYRGREGGWSLETSAFDTNFSPLRQQPHTLDMLHFVLHCIYTKQGNTALQDGNIFKICVHKFLAKPMRCTSVVAINADLASNLSMTSIKKCDLVIKHDHKADNNQNYKQHYYYMAICYLSGCMWLVSDNNTICTFYNMTIRGEKNQCQSTIMLLTHAVCPPAMKITE